MVYFVGAGCGAKDLITVRGARLLSRADVIVYAGSLVNPELLEYAKPDCEIHNSASMTLEEVVSVLVRAEREEKTAVRLHTGDPSVYGAIREQMDCLRQKEIPFSVVPGVSSFCGAAAALQAEYTLPGVSQSVIITRMAGRTPVPEGEELSGLASHGASMAVFLSAGMLDGLRDKLLAGGAYSPQTPAAIVYKATWPEERTLIGTIEDLPKLARENGIDKTALILVGDFLGKHYDHSKLYDPGFSHGCRKADGDGGKGGAPL